MKIVPALLSSMAFFLTTIISSVNGDMSVYITKKDYNDKDVDAKSFNKADTICGGGSASYDEELKEGNWSELQCWGGSGERYCKIKFSYKPGFWKPARTIQPDKRCDGIVRTSNCLKRAFQARPDQRYVLRKNGGELLLCLASDSNDYTGICQDCTSW